MLEYEHYVGRVPQGMINAVAQHIRRFGSFTWTADPSELDLSRPAPLLREFVCRDWTFVIPSNFLGGSVCNLRTLIIGGVLFPQTCPALEMVTCLDASCIKVGDASSRFNLLFNLFPRLEILHLRKIPSTPGAGFPAGPAPRTLREVRLDALPGCNPSILYGAWALETVADVHLVMELAVNHHTASVVAGSLDLSITFRGRQARVVAHLPHGSRRSIFCIDVRLVWDIVGNLAALLQDRAAVAHIHTLQVPLSVLHRVLTTAWPWPRLERMTVHIKSYDILEPHVAEDVRKFRWELLRCLLVAPVLEALALHVHAPYSPATLDDARDLKDHLYALRDCIPREVLVYGFPVDVVYGLSPSDDDSPRVVFMAETDTDVD